MTTKYADFQSLVNSRIGSGMLFFSFACKHKDNYEVESHVTSSNNVLMIERTWSTRPTHMKLTQFAGKKFKYHCLQKHLLFFVKKRYFIGKSSGDVLYNVKWYIAGFKINFTGIAPKHVLLVVFIVQNYLIFFIHYCPLRLICILIVFVKKKMCS